MLHATNSWNLGGRVLTLTLALAAPTAAEDLCGSELTPAEAEAASQLQQQGLYELEARDHRGTLHIPLAFHVVRRTNGTGGLSVDRLLTALNDTDAAFAPVDIQFHLVAPVDYIDDDALYFFIDSSDEINDLRQMNQVPGAVNIYFTNNLSNGSSSLCGISSFTHSSVQGIVVKNSCVSTSTNRSTFPHEVAHYFDIYHTHATVGGAECVDGSNCDDAGDLVCDTPADPRLSGNTVNSNCQYVGNESDSCAGTIYQPDPSNMMSYAPKSCRTIFTQEQLERGYATIVNLRPSLPSDAVPWTGDCNDNGRRDDVDIAFGFSTDADGDGLPDECTPPCPADLIDDGTVNVFDLLNLLGQWGECPRTTRGEGCPADLTGDDIVNVFDLLNLLGAWGDC